MPASTTLTPCPRGWTITGFRSSASSAPPAAAANSDTATSSPTRASTSAGGSPRTPSRIRRPRSARSISAASAASTGAGDSTTSSSTSTSTPPSPTASIGPKSGSRLTPTIISTPASAIRSTRTPLMIAEGANARAFSMMRWNVSRTAVSPSTPSAMPFDSLLWGRSSDWTFIATGPPISPAMLTASPASSARAPAGIPPMPCAESSTFASCSHSTGPVARPVPVPAQISAPALVPVRAPARAPDNARTRASPVRTGCGLAPLNRSRNSRYSFIARIAFAAFAMLVVHGNPARASSSTAYGSARV